VACPWGTTANNDPYDRHCVRCFIKRFPNDPRTTNAKTHLNAKELTVRAFLIEAFPDHRWTFDRGFCVGVLHRPDARLAISTTRILIVEVDEDSHETYLCGDERTREAVFKAHAPRGAIIHLLRFNPDAYDHPVTKQRVPSCFRRSKVDGLVSVDPARKADWEFRLETLRKTIQEVLDHRHETIVVPDVVAHDDDRYASVVPIELFYDDVRAKYGESGNQKKRKAYTGATAAAAAKRARHA